MNFTPDQLAAMTDRDLLVEEYVVVHHTAATEMNEDIVDISQEEMRDQGFIAVGYHFVIHGDGTVQIGRPIEKVPAANLGLNTPSVAIAFEGNFQSNDVNYSGEQPTDAQFDTFVRIVNTWIKPKCKNIKYLIGHRDVATLVNTPGDATACPGDLLYAHLDSLRSQTQLGYPA